MLTLSLDPGVLEEVKAILVSVAPHAEVWAYGSRVKGGSHEGSDLDLVVRDIENLEKKSSVVAALRLAFQESYCPILIDVMDWALLPLSYREEINKAYVLIQTPSMIKKNHNLA